MPAVASSSSSSSSSSASAMTSGAPRSSASAPYAGRPAPRRRRVSSLAADPALSSLGAIYVGWQAGERDPAPLCCPRLAKRSLVQKYGRDAVGYLAVAPQDVVAPASKAGTRTTSAARGSRLDRVPSRPLPSSFHPATSALLPYQSTTTIPLSALPPLPPLESSSSTSSSASEPTLVLPPLPPIPSFHHPHHHLPSTPPELLLQQATSVSVPSPQLIPTPSDAAAPLDFDPGEFLNASLALFQSGGGSGGGAISSRPTSPTLVFPALPPIAPPPSQQFAFVAEPFAASSALGKLDTVPEDDHDESLWSAGEDPLGSCAATDATSEASWAW